MCVCTKSTLRGGKLASGEMSQHRVSYSFCLIMSHVYIQQLQADFVFRPGHIQCSAQVILTFFFVYDVIHIVFYSGYQVVKLHWNGGQDVSKQKKFFFLNWR